MVTLKTISQNCPPVPVISQLTEQSLLVVTDDMSSVYVLVAIDILLNHFTNKVIYIKNKLETRQSHCNIYAVCGEMHQT